LQRRPSGHAATTTAPPIVHEVLRSPGRPLDPATRAFFEPRFGHDFSRVRIHTDARAAESARAVNALAYTVGQDVVFGAGRYAPATPEGNGLLAHELVHTIQQADGHREGGPGGAHIQRAAMEGDEPASAALAEPGDKGSSTVGVSDKEKECLNQGCSLFTRCDDGRFCGELVDCGEGRCRTCPSPFDKLLIKVWCVYKCRPSGAAFLFVTHFRGAVIGPFCVD
jgi:hypothetical protein